MGIHDIELWNRAIRDFNEYLSNAYVFVRLKKPIIVGFDHVFDFTCCFPQSGDSSFEHLYGVQYDNAELQRKKANALHQLRNPYTWRMCSAYTAHVYRKLDCDILIGTQNAGFGLRWDDDYGVFVPVSCIEEDIRDSYDRKNQSGIEYIEIS